MANPKPKTNTKTIGLLGVLLLFVVGAVAYSNIGSTKQYDESKTHDGTNVRILEIDVPGVDVNLVPTDSNQITAHFTGRGRDTYELVLKEKVDGAGLQVIVDNRAHQWIPNLYFGSQQLTLEVQVPKHSYAAANVATSSGDIRVSTLDAKLLQLSSNSGDIELPHFQGDKLEVSASSGDVTIGDVQANVELHTNSGDIKAKGIKGKLNAGTSSGDLQLSQIEGDTTLTTSSGDMRLSGLVASKLNTNTSSGDQQLMQISGAVVDAQSSSGDITVGVQDKMVSMQIHTSSGDAKVALPADEAFDLDFNTSSGDATIGFPMKYSSQGKHIQGTVGTGGPILNVNTSSGSLSVVKE